MRKNKTNKENNNNTLIIAVLSVVCIAILVAAHLFSRESENDFTPVSTENVTTTDTWDENTVKEEILPEISVEESSQVTGSEYDNTQEIISEDAEETVTSLSESTSKEEAQDSKPAEKPETSDNKTNPEKQPEYDSDIPQSSDSEDTTSSAETSSDSHPGQVYDPVFGWITTGDTNQDAVDSDGDISKQIGTMN